MLNQGWLCNAYNDSKDIIPTDYNDSKDIIPTDNVYIFWERHLALLLTEVPLPKIMLKEKKENQTYCIRWLTHTWRWVVYF